MSRAAGRVRAARELSVLIDLGETSVLILKAGHVILVAHILPRRLNDHVEVPALREAAPRSWLKMSSLPALRVALAAQDRALNRRAGRGGHPARTALPRRLTRASSAPGKFFHVHNFTQTCELAASLRGEKVFHLWIISTRRTSLAIHVSGVIIRPPSRV